MATVSLRWPDNLLKETENIANVLHIPRAEYIRRAIAAMNHEVLAQKRRERLIEISQRVSSESMKVNAEFARNKKQSHCLNREKPGWTTSLQRKHPRQFYPRISRTHERSARKKGSAHLAAHQLYILRLFPLSHMAIRELQAA